MTIEAEQVAELEGYVKGKKLHEQLEASGAYEKVRNRRGAQLLRVYLPTQRSAAEANQTLEEPYRKSPGSVIARTMREAFTFLDDQMRQEYGTPEAALKPRTQASMITNGRRNLNAAFEAYHQGTYTGKPLGGRREPGEGKGLHMGRPPGSGNGRREAIQASGVQLWSAIQPLVTPAEPGGEIPIPGVYPHSLTFLETFLTTGKTMSQIARESERGFTVAGVRKNLHTTLRRVWEYIPSEARQGFESSEQVFRRANITHLLEGQSRPSGSGSRRR
ncbi:MAG: hypothetical protein ACRDIV_13910 [Ktedonobacteraceae bacterium]